jgi:Mitochondrial ribosomal death-associated protein 3
LGLEKTSMGPMCLSTVIHVLMHEQDVVPFTIVVDEFNVLFAPGKYFHQDYDESVKNAIPYDQITLFRPILKAMGFPNSSISSNKTNDAVSMKRGAIVAGLTESCAVARQVTDTLVARAQHEASLLSSSSSSLHVVDIPRLTDQEVYCMLANYEAIGIGKLRLDQGETILNPQEVAFLRTVSGSVPQLLMNACII